MTYSQRRLKGLIHCLLAKAGFYDDMEFQSSRTAEVMYSLYAFCFYYAFYENIEGDQLVLKYSFE
jgi:hypothetical protein